MITEKHVKVLVDNVATQTILSKMGTCHSLHLHKLTLDICKWCIARNIWLTVSHIPGKANVSADLESREISHSIEWCLNKDIFKTLCQKLGVIPEIDLFASRINFQIEPYVSFKPDPGSYAVDAFHINWDQYLFYAFPPFSLITKVLRKIYQEKATGIIIVPNWPTQPWWPRLMAMVIQPPLLLPKRRSTIFLPCQPEVPHPLFPKLQLLACHLSGVFSKTMVYHQQQEQSLRVHGDLQQELNTKSTLKVYGSVVQGTLISFHPL